jgi:hypothetical protein
MHLSGETRKEAPGNIQDAIKGYLESLKQHNEPIPPPVSEEIGGWSFEQITDSFRKTTLQNLAKDRIYLPHRRLTIPNHKEIAKGTLMPLFIRQG